jgi:hypothetical protein
MAMTEEDRTRIWAAVYAVVMAYEHGGLSLDEAKDIVVVICAPMVFNLPPEALDS